MARDEQREQADVGADVDDAVAVFDRDAVAKINTIAEDLLVDVIGLVAIEMRDFEAVRQLVAARVGIANVDASNGCL